VARFLSTRTDRGRSAEEQYSTAFALLARLQGALAAGRDFRAFFSCKTHAPTDVLLENIAAVQRLLRELLRQHPEIFVCYLDARLLDVPIFRLHAEPPTDGVTGPRRKHERATGEAIAADAIGAARWCVVGTTPGGVYRMLKKRVGCPPTDSSATASCWTRPPR
jgi:hypothetical protein